ncbi:MAG TPA: hypothetical protein VFO20_16235, partial [Propionibacteriaceae bacterium]|nr:hypothetical protein [Propionibacteriaceae bacterium]
MKVAVMMHWKRADDLKALLIHLHHAGVGPQHPFSRSSSNFLLQQVCSSLLIRRSGGVFGGMRGLTCVVRAKICDGSGNRRDQEFNTCVASERYRKLGVKWELTDWPTSPEQQEREAALIKVLA